MCWLLELYLLSVTKFLIRMRKYFLITSDLLLISLKLTWNDTITWTEWKGGIFNLTLKTIFFMLKLSRMSESKLSRMKFQGQQQERWREKKPFKFLSEVNFIVFNIIEL